MTTTHDLPPCGAAGERHRLASNLHRITTLGATDWRALRGARLFVTGGTGFFGTWLVEAFSWANRHLDLGASLCVLTRDVAAFLARCPHIAHDAAIEFVHGDIRSFEAGHRRFSHVIHAATATSGPVAKGDPEEMFSVITAGTQRVLSMCREHGVRRCLLVSSGAVYGRQPAAVTHLPETWQGGPDQTDESSAYAEGKRAAELLAAIHSRRHGVEVPIARCFAFVGPYLPLNAHFAIGNFIGDVLHGRDVVIKGDGTPRRSYLYAADLVVWLLALLVRGIGGRAYNVGSDIDLSIREVAEVVIDAARRAWPSHPAPKLTLTLTPDPSAEVARYVPSCARVRQELAMPPILPLSEAVLDTLCFYAGLARAPAGGQPTGSHSVFESFHQGSVP